MASSVQCAEQASNGSLGKKGTVEPVRLLSQLAHPRIVWSTLSCSQASRVSADEIRKHRLHKERMSSDCTGLTYRHEPSSDSKDEQTIFQLDDLFWKLEYSDSSLGVEKSFRCVLLSSFLSLPLLWEWHERWWKGKLPNSIKTMKSNQKYMDSCML